MLFRKQWHNIGVKAKINLGLIPAVIMMVVISGMSYISHRRTLIEDSERIAQLIVKHSADEINTFLITQYRMFNKLTTDNVFGMSIEYNTLNEMQDKFSIEHHLPASVSQCRSPSLPCSSRSSSGLPVASALPSSGGRAPLPPAVTPPGYAWPHAAPGAHAASSLAQPRKHHVPHLGTGDTRHVISGDR